METKVCPALLICESYADQGFRAIAVADSVLRCLPEDGTNGFFVACFVRTPIEGEEELQQPLEDVEMTHAARQAAFKAKSSTKGGKHVKGGPQKGKAAAEEKADFGPKVKAVPTPVGKTIVGGKARITAEKVAPKITTKIVSASAAAATPVVNNSTAGKKELTLAEKVLEKKRKSFEKLRESSHSKKSKFDSALELD